MKHSPRSGPRTFGPYSAAVRVAWATDALVKEHYGGRRRTRSWCHQSRQRRTLVSSASKGRLAAAAGAVAQRKALVVVLSGGSHRFVHRCRPLVQPPHFAPDDARGGGHRQATTAPAEAPSFSPSVAIRLPFRAYRGISGMDQSAWHSLLPTPFRGRRHSTKRVAEPLTLVKLALW